jgi:hypothetical protein
LLVGWCLIGVFVAAWGLWNFLHPEVVIEWVGTAEIDTLGYNVRRSENPLGSYTLVNSTLIPVQGDVFRNNIYRFVDYPAKTSTTYYYSIERLYLNQETTSSDPIPVTLGHVPGWETWAGIFLVATALGILTLILRN